MAKNSVNIFEITSGYQDKCQTVLEFRTKYYYRNVTIFRHLS